MAEPFPHAAEPLDFSGSAALFPLPNAVFFPRVIFPLHIFEHRYRKMTADVLAGDRLVAMALLKPGWQMVPEDRLPPIYETVCLSRITAEEKLPDGRYYLVLQGLSRARVVDEAETDLPYRNGRLELCGDVDAELPEAEDQQIREELLRGIQSLQAGLAVGPMFAQALDRDLPLGILCDILAHALQLAPGFCQRILEELNVRRRSQLVLQAIRAEAARRETVPAHFPPKFSRN